MFTRKNLANTSPFKEYKNQLKRNLEFFGNIPSEHYTKFITDAFRILGSGLKIDNITHKNFLYDSEKGFQFIDLDGNVYHNKFYVNEALNFTLINVLNMIGLGSAMYTSQMYKDYIQLRIKLFDCLKDVSANLNDINNQYIGFSKVHDELKLNMRKIDLSDTITKEKRVILHCIQHCDNLLTKEEQQEFIKQLKDIANKQYLPQIYE